MGRCKKRKREKLSEQEIWDDSALLKSWQDAMDEYQFYHSIQAKGENVREILRQAESDDGKKQESALPNDEMEDGEVDEQEEAIDSIQQSLQAAPATQQLHPKEGDPGTTNPGELPSEHQMLENIKMAYYWAGYYSGLYDSQRKPDQPRETSQEPYAGPEK